MKEYKKIYTARTKTVDDLHSLRVDIFKHTEDEVTTKEITLGGDSPILIEYDGDNNVFKPLIQSSATISIVTDEPLLDLYTGKLNDVTVKIYQDDELFWFGFLTPNLYSSDYAVGPNTFTIECIDIIAHLDNIKFERSKNTITYTERTPVLESFYYDEVTGQFGFNEYTTTEHQYEENNFFKSFFEYLNYSMNLIDIENVIDGYVVQENGIDILTMGVQERNFYDETGDKDESEDSRMSCKELLESIIQWMGKSLIYYKNKLFLVDLTKIYNQEYNFYDRVTGEKSSFDIDRQFKFLLDYGVYDADATIEYGSVYNKAVVIENTNQINSIIPDIFDEDEFESVMGWKEDYIVHDILSLHSRNSDAYSSSEWDDDGPQYLNPRTKEEKIRDDNTYRVFNAFFRHPAYFPESLDYEYFLGYNVNADDVNHPTWEDQTPGKITSASFDRIRKVNAIQKYAYFKTYEGEPSQLNWQTCVTLMTNNPLVLQTHRKPSFCGLGGYFILSMDYVLSHMGKYAQTSVFALSPETYGQALKYRDQQSKVVFDNDRFKVCLGVGNMFWNGANWVEVESVSNVADLPTFYVTHRNEYGDAVFGVQKSIDNTVSYRWNLASPQDGFAIPLPERTLAGKITFMVYPIERIGLTAQRFVNGEGGYIGGYRDSGWDIYDGFVLETRPIGTGNYYTWELPYGYSDGNVANSSTIDAVHINKLSLTYTTKDTVKDVFNLQQYEGDIRWTNMIDEEYVAELDDIQLTTNTYNSKAVSYSYVLQHSTDDENDYQYVQEVNGMIMEHHLLQKLVEYYKVPRLTYHNNLNSYDITPFSRVRVNSLSKTFTVTSVSYDLKNHKASITGLEI